MSHQPQQSERERRIKHSAQLKWDTKPRRLRGLAYRAMGYGGIHPSLSMLYPRLQLMRRLLSDRGTIYVHIGPDVAAYVKVLLDEVFGRDQRRAEVIWQSVTSHNDARGWGMVHQYIYMYTKTSSFDF